MFSRIMAVGFPLGHMTFLAMEVMVTHGHQDNDAKYGFYLLGQGLNPFRKWFVIPMMSVPLLHQWA